MPSPIGAFVDIAARYGEVDPTNIEAVQHWFSEVLPTLPPDAIEEILEELLRHEGTIDHPSPAKVYPKSAPLPSLSSSPPAPLPWPASNWRELLIRFMRRNSDS